MSKVRVNCPGCRAAFEVDAERIAPSARGRCPKCATRFYLSEAVPSGESEDVTADVAAPVPASNSPTRKRTEVRQTQSPTVGGVSPQPSSAATSPRSPVPASSPPRPAPLKPVPPTPPPSPPSRDPTNAKPATPPELAQLAAWRGKIEPVRTSFGYRLAVFAVMLVVVTLPLLYVALIAATAWGVYLHTVHDTTWITFGRGRARAFAFLAYVAPIVAGAILILFMIKPLFSRPAKGGRNQPLSRDNEPLLFSFVDRLTAAVGAARPRRIEVDCQVNASAGLRRGFLSLFGSDLVLVIGLPLVAGLTLREMAGVLAHEFGHFAQASGMRVSYVVRSINMWFQRVVYERDEWDERLARWSTQIDYRLAIVLLLARFFVWLTRWILWFFMLAAHAVSCHLLRQMEFDADRHEARLAGSDAFASTSRKLNVLNLAYQGAMADLGQMYDEGRLADDLPGLIAANVDQIPANVVEDVLQRAQSSPTGWFDTHPAHGERVASAARENAPGEFRVEAPATLLFADFDRLSKHVTRSFYRESLGPEAKFALVPTAEVVSRTKARQQASQAVDQYFFEACGMTRPLTLPFAPQFAEPLAADVLAERILDARRHAGELANDYRTAFERFNHYDNVAANAAQAAALRRADVKLDRGAFDFATDSIASIGDVRRDAERHQQRFARDMEDFERAAALRMALALQFLYIPRAAECWPDAADRRQECTRLCEVLAAIAGQLPAIQSLRRHFLSLQALGQFLRDEPPAPLVCEVRDAMKALHAQMGTLRQALAEVDYPFDHASGKVALGKFLLAERPDPDDLGGIYDASDGMLDRLVACYYRAIGRLVVLALDAESALDIPPLEPQGASPAA